MARILLIGGIAVTEIPQPTIDGAGGQIGEVDGQIERSTGGIEIERGFGSRRQNRDAIGTGEGVFTCWTCRRQRDGVDPFCGVGMGWVLLCGAISITKVPQPRFDSTGGSIGEVDEKIVLTFTHTGGEPSDGGLGSNTLPTTPTATGEKRKNHHEKKGSQGSTLSPGKCMGDIE